MTRFEMLKTAINAISKPCGKHKDSEADCLGCNFLSSAENPFGFNPAISLVQTFLAREEYERLREATPCCGLPEYGNTENIRNCFSMLDFYYFLSEVLK